MNYKVIISIALVALLLAGGCAATMTAPTETDPSNANLKFDLVNGVTSLTYTPDGNETRVSITARNSLNIYSDIVAPPAVWENPREPLTYTDSRGHNGDVYEAVIQRGPVANRYVIDNPYY